MFAERPTRRATLVGLGGAALASAPALSAPPAQVLVIATLHGLHGRSHTYTYDDVYDLLARFRPDLVGVEIRPEDLGQADDYLAANYPREMIEAVRRYRDKVFGFDWLGDEIAGAPVPPDWWRTRSRVKQLERDLGVAPELQTAERKAIAARMEAAQAEQAAIAKAATAASLNDGRYDAATRRYYAEFARLTAGTSYAEVAAFYAERDERIDEAVAAVVQAHAGARIAILTGADHRGPLVARLKRLRGAVHLVSVEDAGRT